MMKMMMTVNDDDVQKKRNRKTEGGEGRAGVVVVAGRPSGKGKKKASKKIRETKKVVGRLARQGATKLTQAHHSPSLYIYI